MNESEIIKSIKRRLAQVAVGSSALRNQGSSGIISICREYLENSINLDVFFITLTQEREFRSYLDKNTVCLMSDISQADKNWGTARKALNLFFRDIVYNKPICDYFGVANDYIEYNKTVQFLEIPLDKHVATELYQLSDCKLPKWKTIRDLSIPTSDSYQEFAKEIASNKCIPRIHLDTFYWRKNQQVLC